MAINLFISFSLSAQQSSVSQKIIYTGLDNPTSIYATQQHLFVVESGKHRILKLDHNGKIIETLGGLGTGDYEFDTPIDIDATNGLKIYVSDYRNNRVQVFDRRFQYLTTITASREQRKIRPTQLVVNDFGELFLYDEASKAILKYDENGSLRNQFSFTGPVTEISEFENGIDIFQISTNTSVEMSWNGIFSPKFIVEYLLMDYVVVSRTDNYEFKLFPTSIVRRSLSE
ncbi:MAG: hypothetical protein ACMZ7B_07165 [Balneola sp.]